jgi:hypothetical protein
LIAGVRYRLTGIYEGFATRDHAEADCKRHRALTRVAGETRARGLVAKAKVLDDALREAAKLVEATTNDLEAHRATAQDATAMRLRVDELRALATDAHRELTSLPQPSNRPLGAAMREYQSADADMERDEGKLRRAQAIDVSVRGGVDAFLDQSNPTPYFAVISVALNIGALWQGSGNDRAAAARKRYVEAGHDPLGVDASLEHIDAEIEVETGRAQQVGALVDDLGKQLETLAKLSGDDAKRFRQTMWFDWIKARAEQAYLAAHLASLHEVVAR